jgi:deoxyribose-phosphate aldolase
VASLPTTRAELAQYIDHTLLKPEALAADIEQLCREAREYDFFAVCVNPVWVPRCVELLRGSQTCVASVAGFPLGASVTPVKALEARLAVEQGAAEVDMVVNLAALRAADKAAVVRDIAEVVTAAKRANENALVKVILETRALSTEQIVLGCRCVAEAQADFVKTSTGFHPAGGATPEHVALLHRHCAPIRVKAAGGIRELGTALAMIRSGAARLGMSASVAVLRGLEA